jgi:voltage-gated potassium channel
VYPSRRLTLLVTLLLAVIAFASAWYALVEGFGLLDAVYQAVTTISTVGFREVRSLDTSGRIFTIVYILGGIGVMFYVATAIIEELVVGGLVTQFTGSRQGRRIRRMHDHHVVCGFGRVGHEIASELSSRGHDVLVIDRDQAKLVEAREIGYATVHGDATEESTLEEAQVSHAQTLIAAADSDAGNTYIALTARAMNADLFIVARAGSDQAEKRLLSVGANRVVSPYRIGGRRMALSVVQPLVIDFVDHLSAHEPHDENILAEVLVSEEGEGLAGHRLSDVFGELEGVRVLGVYRASGAFELAPTGPTLLDHGDRLMLFGDEREIERLSSDGVVAARS